MQSEEFARTVTRHGEVDRALLVNRYRSSLKIFRLPLNFHKTLPILSFKAACPEPANSGSHEVQITCSLDRPWFAGRLRDTLSTDVPPWRLSRGPACA